MSILNKLKSMKKQARKEKNYENNLLEIVRIVSCNNRNLLDQAEKCIEDTGNYYVKHFTEYEERGIDSDEDHSLLQWIGCIDLLIQCNYACECDWKEEKSSFLYQMLQLEGIKQHTLKIRAEWINEHRTIPEWCEKIDREWYKEKYAVAAFNIESDSYVLFICNLEDLGQLTILAEDFGYQIDFAKNM